MLVKESTPSMDGYHMPGEFEYHQGCIMIWPNRPGSWPFGAKAAKRAFAEVAAEISKSERVYMLAEERLCAEAAEYLRALVPAVIVTAAISPDELKEQYLPSVEIIPIPTDDAWARDVCPTFVVKDVNAKDEYAKDHPVNENDAGKDPVDEKKAASGFRGISWRFNAWGGEYDGLYAHWEQDDACAGRVCEYLGVPYYDAGDFVLEGGSIHSDGEGTVLVTEACLLSPGRNPKLTKEEIEEKLKDYLGAKKIIWLPHGIYGDETNEHVDNVCAFVRPGEVVLAWPEESEKLIKAGETTEPEESRTPEKLTEPEESGTPAKSTELEKSRTSEKTTEPEKMGTSERSVEPEKPRSSEWAAEPEKSRISKKTAEQGKTDEVENPGPAGKIQLQYSEECLRVLESERDAMGRKIRVHKLPLPRHPVCIQKEDLPGFVSEEGEAVRYEGEQLAASYVNFYIANRSVLVPQFHDENDTVALEILAKLFPEREIVPIYARDILMGGGNIHCITQQIPAGIGEKCC